MSIGYAIYTLGNTAFFTSRAFLPAFVTAMILRFPEYVPFFSLNMDITESTHWFVSNECIITLAVLSILEILADKDPGIRELLGSVDSFIKSIVMFGTTLAVMDMQSVGFQSMGYTMESVTVTFAAAFERNRLSYRKYAGGALGLAGAGFCSSPMPSGIGWLL